MKILKIIGFLALGLCFASIAVLMQLCAFYVMFIQVQVIGIPFILRVLLFVGVEVIGLGFAIDTLKEELKEWELVRLLDKLK